MEGSQARAKDRRTWNEMVEAYAAAAEKKEKVWANLF